MLLRALVLPLFRRIHRFDAWFRRRLTPLGWILLGTCLAGGVFGIDTRQTLAAYLFTLAGAYLLIGWLGALRPPPALSLTRRLPDYGMEDRPIRYRVACHNPTRRVQRDLQIRERPQARFPDAQAMRDPSLPVGLPGQHLMDRLMGYRRWSALVDYLRGVRTEAASIPTLPPGGRAEVTVTLHPERRGYVELAGLQLMRPDPLGLVYAIRSLEQPARLLVLPPVHPMPQLYLSGQPHYQVEGSQAARRSGGDEEFVGLRPFRPGDPVNRIHWRSMAKLGYPLVQELEDEFRIRSALVLDTVGAAEAPYAFEGAVSVAASLAAARRDAALALELLLAGPTAHPLASDTDPESTLLAALAQVRPTPARVWPAFRALIARHVPYLDTIFFVTWTWDAERAELAEYLQRRGVQARILAVDPPEALPAGARSVPRAELAQALAEIRD